PEGRIVESQEGKDRARLRKGQSPSALTLRGSSWLNRVDDRVQRRARPHRLRYELGIRVVVAADVDRLALHRDQLIDDLLLVALERFGDAPEARRQPGVLGLIRERSGPVHREIEMAAAIVQAAELACRRL